MSLSLSFKNEIFCSESAQCHVTCPNVPHEVSMAVAMNQMTLVRTDQTWCGSSGIVRVPESQVKTWRRPSQGPVEHLLILDTVIFSDTLVLSQQFHTHTPSLQPHPLLASINLSSSRLSPRRSASLHSSFLLVYNLASVHLYLKNANLIRLGSCHLLSSSLGKV